MRRDERGNDADEMWKKTEPEDIRDRLRKMQVKPAIQCQNNRRTTFWPFTSSVTRSGSIFSTVAPSM